MIFNLGGAAFKPPVLNPNYPENVTVIEGLTASATFDIVIQEQGEPAEYTYQWFVNGVAVEGANGPSYTKSGLTSQATYTVYCEVANEVGVVTSRIATLTVESGLPEYTFSGSHQMIDDGAGNWRIRLLTTGTLKFADLGSAANGIDVFCVGGGGGGSAYQYANASGGGAGGGYTKTYKSVAVAVGTNYTVVIGGGGVPQLTTVGGNGGQSYFSSTSYAANGGYGAGRGTSGNKTNRYYGGDGGSGGAGVGTNNGTPNPSAAGGSDGNNGNGSLGGIGQGATTREFGESGATLYAGGGAACKVLTTDQNITGADGGGGGIVNSRGQNGGTNTGGGGAGSGVNASAASSAGTGGSGIVIIRNHR